MKQSAASTTPVYHLPPFPAAVGHNTVSTLTRKRELSVDSSVDLNTLRSSARHCAQLNLDDLSRLLPISHLLEQCPARQATIARPLNGPLEKATPFADGHFNALALC